VRFGIYLQDDGPKLGRGKIHLLTAIREHGSISAAARSMNMSYRHAWMMLDELNRTFDEPVIVSSAGGASGGGAQLTDWGAELIERFSAMEQAANAAIADQVDALATRAAKPEAKPESKPEGAARRGRGRAKAGRKPG